jgi:hypothetical protein
MNIATLVALFLISVGAIFGFTAWRDYRHAGNQWTIAAAIRRRTGFIFGAIGIALLLFTLLPGRSLPIE